MRRIGDYDHRKRDLASPRSPMWFSITAIVAGLVLLISCVAYVLLYYFVPMIVRSSTAWFVSHRYSTHTIARNSGYSHEKSQTREKSFCFRETQASDASNDISALSPMGAPATHDSQVTHWQLSRRLALPLSYSVLPEVPKLSNMRISLLRRPHHCKDACQCQCHTSSTYRTTRWITQIFGGMIVRGNGFLLLSRDSCDKASCLRGGAVRLDVYYHFPAWTFITRSIYLQIEKSFGLGFQLQ
jgi:hypothetical protein